MPLLRPCRGAGTRDAVKAGSPCRSTAVGALLFANVETATADARLCNVPILRAVAPGPALGDSRDSGDRRQRPARPDYSRSDPARELVASSARGSTRCPPGEFW